MAAFPVKVGSPGPKIGTALREIGYSGAVVMEPFVKVGGGVGSDIKVWRDLSDNAEEAQMDEDARQLWRFHDTCSAQIPTLYLKHGRRRSSAARFGYNSLARDRRNDLNSPSKSAAIDERWPTNDRTWRNPTVAPSSAFRLIPSVRNHREWAKGPKSELQTETVPECGADSEFCCRKSEYRLQCV